MICQALPIGVIGSGTVGQALAAGYAQKGHAVAGSGATSAVESAGAALNGKVVIDACNPIAGAPARTTR